MCGVVVATVLRMYSNIVFICKQLLFSVTMWLCNQLVLSSRCAFGVYSVWYRRVHAGVRTHTLCFVINSTLLCTQNVHVFHTGKPHMWVHFTPELFCIRMYMVHHMAPAVFL